MIALGRRVDAHLPQDLVVVDVRRHLAVIGREIDHAAGSSRCGAAARRSSGRPGRGCATGPPATHWSSRAAGRHCLRRAGSRRGVGASIRITALPSASWPVTTRRTGFFSISLPNIGLAGASFGVSMRLVNCPTMRVPACGNAATVWRVAGIPVTTPNAYSPANFPGRRAKPWDLCDVLFA